MKYSRSPLRSVTLPLNISFFVQPTEESLNGFPDRRICEEFGFTTTAAITVFMKTVVRERRIPFEIKAAGKDEINAIIKEVRDAR